MPHGGRIYFGWWMATRAAMGDHSPPRRDTCIERRSDRGVEAMKTTLWKLPLMLGLLASAAPLAVAQIGLVSTDSSGPTERSDAFNTTRAPAGSSLSAPGMLAAPYGT